MAFPAIAGIRQTISRLPVLSGEDVQSALDAAKKTIPESKVAALRDSLNDAFRIYFVERLWRLWAEKAPAAKVANHVKRIGATADRLLALLGLSDETGVLPDPLRLILWRQAGIHAESIGGYPELAPREFVAVRGDDNIEIRRLDFRGDEKIAECLKALLLLRKLLHQAHKYERRKVTPPESRARREGDEAMQQLFGNVNGIWFDFFDEVPGAGWNAYRGEASGPYVLFVVALFNALRAKLPEEITLDYPKLAHGIELNANAVRSRFRRSGIPKLKQIAARMA